MVIKAVKTRAPAVVPSLSRRSSKLCPLPFLSLAAAMLSCSPEWGWPPYPYPSLCFKGRGRAFKTDIESTLNFILSITCKSLWNWCLSIFDILHLHSHFPTFSTVNIFLVVIHPTPQRREISRGTKWRHKWSKCYLLSLVLVVPIRILLENIAKFWRRFSNFKSHLSRKASKLSLKLVSLLNKSYW